MRATYALLTPFAAAWLACIALGVLVHAETFRVYDAGTLPSSRFLNATAYTLAPDAWLQAQRTSWLGLLVITLFILVVGCAIASWVWAVRVAQRLAQPFAIWPVLLMTTLLAMPVLAFTGLFSDDVYLYHLYGRTIATHGGNPLDVPPSGFPHDPHLDWVHWRELRSAYGPVWLMWSSVLSAIAGDSITAAVIVYRVAGLGTHLLTVLILWRVLQTTAPRAALAGTIFYGWNPLVLVEVVGNAHNDAIVALFAVMAMTAIVHRAWRSSAFFAACAVMVKPFSGLLLVALAVRMLGLRGSRRLRQGASAAAIAAITMLVVSLPLWAGTALVENIADNPASYIYTNSMWELISESGPALFNATTVSLQHPYLDIVRGAIFLIGAGWILCRRSARRDAAGTALALWVLFCLTASWIWPWYFVPALALAPLAGATGWAVGVALTCSGLLFWIAWPPMDATLSSTLHFWRSLVLLGPLLLVATCSPVRRRLASALGIATPPKTVPAISDATAVCRSNAPSASAEA